MLDTSRLEYVIDCFPQLEPVFQQSALKKALVTSWRQTEWCGVAEEPYSGRRKRQSAQILFSVELSSLCQLSNFGGAPQ